LLPLLCPRAFLSPATHAKSCQIKAIASLNHLTLHIPPSFEFGVTNRSPSFLSKFPLGRIPALEVTGTGFLLTEASAIAWFVAENGPRKDQLLGSTPEERALVTKWVSFADAHLYGTVAALAGPRIPKGPGIPIANGTDLGSGADPYAGKETELRADLENWLKYIDDELSDGRPYLLPGTKGVSVADISLAGTLKLGMKYYVDEGLRTRYGKMTAWYKRAVSIPEVADAFGDCRLLEEQ
jgi:elongation factor 1-gamma